MKHLIIFVSILSLSGLNNLIGQENMFSKTQFMIRGYGHAGFEYTSVNGKNQSSYVGSTFAPIFLFKHSDRLLFESELEFELENNQVNVGFEYADMSYILNNYMTIRMGKFLLPFGTFVERLHPAWINRLSNMPLGFGHDGIAPSSGIGVELRGGFAVGGSKLNYSVYTTNGPVLKDGSNEPEEAGMLLFENFEDNNNNKAIGGRIGYLPFSNSSVEIGFSVYSGKVGNTNDSLYGNTGANLMAGDFTFVKQVSPLYGIIDIKAQYNLSLVDKADYFELEPGETIPTQYTFENKSDAYFAQLSYRPTMAGSNIIKNFEIIGRYSVINTPEGSLWEQQASQISYGLNYWLSWRTVFKLSYQTTNSEGGHDSPGTTKTNAIFLHWALGF
ncbi:MAG: hypothetical protein GXO79_15140 [Chlorobi bacterium]|nr:hypothetical protein [Chlorobiota bacterium]